MNEGKYDMRDVYDALEVAVNDVIRSHEWGGDPAEALATLRDLVDLLPVSARAPRNRSYSSSSRHRHHWLMSQTTR